MLKVDDNYTFLTTAPISRAVLRMAFPSIVSMLISSLYNLADTYFVGRINTQITAAIGVSFPVMTVIQAIGFFFGHGSGNFISRELGAKERDRAVRMAITGFIYSILFGLLIAIFGVLFLTPLCRVIGSTPTILPYSAQYLGIVLIGAPFMTASITINNQMRFQGNAYLAMAGIVTGALLNVILDPIFIFVLDMGIKGAALATLVSQLCGFIILLIVSGKGENIPLVFRKFTPTLSYIKEIIYGGTPSLSRQGLGCISMMLLNHAAGLYGDAAIAGMSIVTRISNFIFSAIVGLGQGYQPLCGFCYGAKLYERVRAGFNFCVKSGTLVLLVLAVLGYIFAADIVETFRRDPEVVEVGKVALRWQVCTYPLIATILMSNMLLQTIRKPILANIVAAARNGLFFIPLILILPRYFGLWGVESCQAFSDICSIALSAPIAWFVFSKMKEESRRLKNL